ncbi:MAG: lipopolysaccharide heptosyltransferase II [Bacteroidetes bacterium]|nr:lipopolysaccharide heptosyltransferase II [Bacteroidota bacterium]
MTAHAPAKVLVLRLSSIGDIILTTPFLRVFKQRFPGCELHYAVRREFAELLHSHPHVDRLITIDPDAGRTALRTLNLMLLSERYDAVFDLHNNFRTRVLRNGLSRRTFVIDKRSWRRLLLVTAHVNLYHDILPVPDRYIETARTFALKPDTSGPELRIPEDRHGIARLALHAAGRRIGMPLAGLCPGAKHFTKRWPTEGWVTLAVRLLHRGYDLAIFGSEDDHAIAERIKRLHPARIHDCTTRLSLLETAAAMEFCDVLFTNDSGLMHMATAVGKPVVAVFGSTVREFGFFPYHTTAAVVEVDGLPCRPCTHIGRADCPRRHFACLRAITVDDVLHAFDSLPIQTKTGESDP